MDGTENDVKYNVESSASATLLQNQSDFYTISLPNLEHVENLSNVCRICATMEDLVIPIFEGEGLKHELAEKINQYLPIQVQVDEEMPMNVCVKCAHSILTWHSMYTRCTLAEHALRARLLHLHAKAQKAKRLLLNKQKAETQTATSSDPHIKCSACPFCGARRSAPALRRHLISEHFDYVFLCDECDQYVAKKDFLQHMAFHLAASSKPDDKKIENNHEHSPASANNQPKYDNEDKKSRSSRRDSRDVPPPRHVKNDTSISSPNDKKSPRSAPQAEEPKKVKRTRKKKIVPRIDDHDSDDEVIPRKRNLKSEPTATAIQCKTEGEEKRQNEFSDQSEPEFGLPDAVFEAIEDSDPETPLAALRDKKRKAQERTCPICSKVYTASSSYFYHMKYTHRKSKEHRCETCGRMFGTRGSLTAHMALHTDRFQFECHECHKRFRSKASLYIHEQGHSGVKSFQCATCSAAFRWRTHLKRHMKRHAAERTHVCSHCGRGFNVRCDLLRHLETHAPHTHTCDKCGAKFSQRRYLKVHISNKHSADISHPPPE